MSNLIIRDLAGDKALDKGAMSEIKGGFQVGDGKYYVNYCKPYLSTAQADAFGQFTFTSTLTGPGESHSVSASSNQPLN